MTSRAAEWISDLWLVILVMAATVAFLAIDGHHLAAKYLAPRYLVFLGLAAISWIIF